MLDAEGCGLLDLRVCRQNVIDLLGVDLLPSPIDLLLGSAFEEKVAVSIEITGIACDKPTVAPCLCRCFFIALVFRNNVFSLNEYLPRFVRAKLVTIGAANGN